MRTRPAPISVLKMKTRCRRARRSETPGYRSGCIGEERDVFESERVNKHGGGVLQSGQKATSIRLEVRRRCDNRRRAGSTPPYDCRPEVFRKMDDRQAVLFYEGRDYRAGGPPATEPANPFPPPAKVERHGSPGGSLFLQNRVCFLFKSL